MALIFAEYIEHDPAMPFQLFRHHGRQDWAGEGDTMVLNIGRTMRLAGEPLYMCWWQIKGMARIDEWEAHFRTPEGRLYMADTPVPRALRFTRNGIYEALLGQGSVPAGLHLLEHFAPGEMSDTALRAAFEERARAAPAGRLLYVIRRLARLGPDPGGMALWTFASYAEAEPFLRASPPAGALAVVAAGLYRNFGDELP